MFNIDEITVNTNRNLLEIENELIENVIKYKRKGVIVKIFVSEVENILSKNTAKLLYRFNMIYNNTDTINKYFNEIQIRAKKGEDILKLHEYYYLIDILLNETQAIKINYIIRRMNYLFSNYNILPAKEYMIKKEIKQRIEWANELILATHFYKGLNQIAMRIVLDVAEEFNLDNKKAI